MRNITIARGTKETLPLHLFSEACSPVKQTLANFAQTVCRGVKPPMLLASPPRRTSRPQPQAVTIRRSERLAKKSRHRATKPVVQVQNVMMKKLGLTSDSRPPDASAIHGYFLLQPYHLAM